MAEAIQQYFDDVLSRYDGLLAIIITDRDGVPIVKVADSKVPSSALRPSFLATFATATEQILSLSNRCPLGMDRALVTLGLQLTGTTVTSATSLHSKTVPAAYCLGTASKLGLSKNKNIICTFPSYQVVHFNYLPVVVSVVATSESNTGLILSLEKNFSEAVKHLRVAVDGE